MDPKIDYLNLALPNEIVDECLKKISSIIKVGNYIMGDEVEKFENSVAEKFGSKYVVGLNSGFSALYLALLALGITEGDEVVTVGNSFAATVACAHLLGAKVVYCDVGEDRNMFVEQLKYVVTEKTKAIIPVHLAGIPANMKEIVEFSKKRNIFVVEDGSQAFGAKIRDKYVGTFGDVGCFSMHPTKNLGAFGDAGFIVTDNDEIYKKVSLLKNHGLQDREHCICFGYNSRLDEVQAGIINVKLKYVDSWNERRNRIAHMYYDNLSDLDITLPVRNKDCYSVYFSYVIQTDKRDELKKYLEERNVECKIHYPIAIHRQKASIDAYGEINLPNTDIQNDKILSLPIYPYLPDEKIKYIIMMIRQFYKEKIK